MVVTSTTVSHTVLATFLGVDNRGNHGNRGDHRSVVSFSFGFSLRLGFSFGFGFSLPPPANWWLGHTGLDEVGAGVDHGGGVGGSLGGLGARGRHHLAALLCHHHVLVQVQHGLAHLARALNLAGLASLHWSQCAHWLGIASIHIQAVNRLSLRISNRLRVCGSFGLSPHEGGRGEGGADEEGEESHNGSRGCKTRSRLPM